MDKTLVGLVMMFLIGFTLFMSFVMLNRPLTGFIRAYEDSTASPIKSVILAWPLSAPADASTQVKITVIPRNTKGESLAGRDVTINTTLGSVEQLDPIDGEEQYIFYLTSDREGIAEIEAIVDNIKIQRTVSVKFE